MKFERQETEQGVELSLAGEPDWSFFNRLADSLQEHLNGDWQSQLDGLDQRYWDLRIGDALLTLHLDEDCGISLYVASDAPDGAASRIQLERAAKFLAAYR